MVTRLSDPCGDCQTLPQTGPSHLTEELAHLTGDRMADIRSGNVAIDALEDAMNELDREALRDDEPALDWIDD